MEQTAVRAIGGCHPVTVKLINKLETGKSGDSLTDSELKQIAGTSCGVMDKGYGYLTSAIRYCERNGIIWQRQRGQNAILCLNGEEIAERAITDVRHVRRYSRRALNRLSTVDPATLPMQKRSFTLALSAQLGAMVLMSRTETTKKIVSSGQNTPQIEDVIKIFNNK